MVKIIHWLKLNWLAVACLVATFFLLAALCFNLDPDLGWHLRAGKDLVVNHIFPRTDFYTFAFLGYPWRDHEWLAEAPLYYLWHFGGYSLLVIIFSFLWFLPFWLTYREKDLTKKSFFVFIAVYISMSFIGVRLQVLTLLGLAVLIRLFDNYLKGDKKLLYFYPVIIFLWANLHGSFVYGLLAGLIFILFNIRGPRRIWLNFLPFFLLAAGLTFINPYGFGLWREIWIALQPGYKSMISEWQPIFSLPAIYPVLIYYILFTVFLTANYFRKFSFPNYYLVLVVIFFFLGAISKRNVPIFVLLSLPLFIECLRVDYLTSRLEALSRRVYRPLIFTVSLVVAAIHLNVPATILVNPDPFQKNWGNYPPQEIIEKLKKLPNGTPVFASYDFGGDLIYRLPNIKIFIDGRASYWRLNNQLAVKTYMESLKNYKKFEELQKQYGFEVILTGSLTDGTRVDRLTGADLSNYDWQDLSEKIIHSGEWKFVIKNNNQNILVKKDSLASKILDH